MARASLGGLTLERNLLRPSPLKYLGDRVLVHAPGRYDGRGPQ